MLRHAEEIIMNVELQYRDTSIVFDDKFNDTEKKELEENQGCLIGRKLEITYDSENIIIVSKGVLGKVVICADLTDELVNEFKIFSAAIELEYNRHNIAT